MKCKIDVVSGFLGAGKTMLIQKIIKEKLYSEKIVIIENEFGEVGIDGRILKQTGIEVKEINAGCICCSIAGDFKKTIEEVLEKYKPDRIIIEPSGVGKLSDVLMVIKNSEQKNRFIANMIITVVDVLKFDMYIENFGEFYRNQIENANTIVFSRTQNISIEKLEKIAKKVHELNKKANIITTPWDQISGQILLEIAQQDTRHDLVNKVSLLKKPVEKVVARVERNGSLNNHQAKEVFTTWSIETPKRFTEIYLKNILTLFSKSNEYGNILRAKGILQESEKRWMQFDYVPGEYEVRSTEAEYTGRICVIGKELKKELLTALFNL